MHELFTNRGKRAPRFDAADAFGFPAAGREGVIRAESTPVHRGRTTQVWQTRVTDASGRLLSMTIQTQLVLRD